jgi:hypothetical protein
VGMVAKHRLKYEGKNTVSEELSRLV